MFPDRMPADLVQPLTPGTQTVMVNDFLLQVMDYADGGDLHQRIQRTRQAGKVFSEDRIVRPSGVLWKRLKCFKMLQDVFLLESAFAGG